MAVAAPSGFPSPDIPRDPTSPEIKVPTYWLQGVVKFTDTAVRSEPLDVRELHMDRYSFSLLSLLSASVRSPRRFSFDSKVNGAMITFAVSVFFIVERDYVSRIYEVLPS